MTTEGNYMQEHKRLLDYREAAEYLGIKKSTLQTMVCRRQIECVKVGRRTYFTREILEQFVSGNTQPAITD
jgi:excisionase family DNA binding protein